MQRIRELEREIIQMRARHSEAIQQLKAVFLHEKHDCQANADKKIAIMAKQANQVAYLPGIFFSFVQPMQYSMAKYDVCDSGTVMLADHHHANIQSSYKMNCARQRGPRF